MSVRSIDAKVGYAPGERNYGDKRQMPELANDSAEEIDAPRPNLISSGHGGKSAFTPRHQWRNVDVRAALSANVNEAVAANCGPGTSARFRVAGDNTGGAVSIAPSRTCQPK